MRAVLLIILFAHGGCWFGNSTNSITVTWANPAAGTPEATLAWKLFYGPLEVRAGQAEVAPGQGATNIRVALPAARVRCAYTWTYALQEKATGKILESGERRILAFPADVLQPAAKRAAGRTIGVVEPAEGEVAGVLTAAGVPAVRFGSVGDVQVRPLDVVFVGQEALPADEAAQAILLDKARGGTSVMLFAQMHARVLCEYPAVRRPIKGAGLRILAEHPLLDGLEAGILEEWARGPDDLAAVALPPGARALPVAAFPAEAATAGALRPVDALVVTHKVGAGRIVYWQLPVDDWKGDPRAALLLANALDYLATRPEPATPLPAGTWRRSSASTTPPPLPPFPPAFGVLP
jgi:hypothetical protein